MSSSLSPSSSSASVSRTLTHHVFLSFRGADVRINLLTHILGEFQRKGITPFIDNEMERGASLGPELLRAIKAARITIVIFSRNYASSSWCLDELVEIMKCKDEWNQKVMTIFHQVKPTDVRHQGGDFGKAFEETCVGKSEKLKQLWKKTLTDAANIHGDGVESDKWNSEAEMISKIATDVLGELQSTQSKDFDNYTGLQAHMTSIYSLLRLHTDEIKMIGIWGPSGIGKTTISRVLLDKLSPKFRLSARIGDIKRRHLNRHDEYGAKKELQKELVCELLKQKSIEIFHLEIAKERFHDKEVLVILDDVNELWQLQATVHYPQWFGGGSRIIITTQDRRVLEKHGIKDEDIYKVDYPSTDESLQIFCSYAFDQKHPHQGFEDLAKEVTELASNLPLALQVMGSHFKQMTKEVWEMELKNFKKSRLHKDILEILKFSYEALTLEEKYLFNDIACIFNGYMIDGVEEIIGDGFRRRLRVLEEKSLIFTYDGKIGMHTLLTKLVREEIEGCTVLVDAQKICNAFTFKRDNLDVRGIILDLYEMTHKLDIEERVFEGMLSLEYLIIDRFIINDGILRQLRSDHYLPDQLNVPQGLKYLPYKLKWLCWNQFPMTSMPSEFHPNFLVKLEMNNSKLEKLWEGIPPLGSLKEIDLSGSENLKELPNLSNATSLKRLRLDFCESLVEIPSSIGNATNLEEIYLSNCTNLVKIPYSIGNLNKLMELKMSGCSNLEAIPYNPIVPPSNQNLSPKVLPTNINMESLSRLDLSWCKRIETFPDISTSIEYLNLTDTAIEELPSSIVSLFRLRELDLIFCRNLVSLPQLPDSLLFLKAYDCESLRRIQGPFQNPQICLSFNKCSNLSDEARELIMISDCKCALIPGEEVPAYFEHQAKGDLVRVNLDQRIKLSSKRETLPLFLRFKACLVLPRYGGDDFFNDKQISCHVLCIQKDQVIGSSGLCKIDLSHFGLLNEHLYIFKSSMSLDIPEINVNHVKLEFQFKADTNIEIQRCGVHLEDHARKG